MSSFSLFEISWEVCNKVGGIYTVLSTKARTLVERFGDDYVVIGPWLLGEGQREAPFDEQPGAWPELVRDCAEAGLEVRVGRWRTPGRPRAILVEFSKLYQEKDDILASLWEDYEVDSLSGDWDYVEPVLFGHAAARVVELFWENYLDRRHRRAVVQAHEWMTASALLRVQKRLPALGTVFTTHATMLGRALSSLGHSPEDGLGDRTPEELASEHGVVAKHSIEGVAAREADVFTTVSEITAREAELLHGRAPDPLLPNGIDLAVVDEVAGPVGREEAREKLLHLAGRFLGQDVSDALLLAVSGRYEFHNKGLDVLLDALARVDAQPGRRIVLLALVPAGNSGPRREVLERLELPLEELQGPCGIATHNLFEEEHDPIGEHCARLGLDNAPERRVMIIHVPIYLDASDGFLNLPYEAVLRGTDLSCFPSYYEPWGYTPQESLAVGVPTISTDYAGFGRWALAQGLGPEAGVTVVSRVHRENEQVVSDLAGVIADFAADPGDPVAMREECRRTAARTAWSDLIANYERAYELAVAAVSDRLGRGVPQARRRRPIPVEPSPQGARPRLVPFEVSARLPEELEDLRRLSRNLWWSWDREARQLFGELWPAGWESTRHNPVALLAQADHEALEARAADAEYLQRLTATAARFDAYVAATPEEDASPSGSPGFSRERPIAYFSAEYGLHESLPIYSGGLGVLAGDHLKSASDLNLPLVAVGLFYRHGYLAQRLSSEGEQLSLERENDPRLLPLEPVLTSAREPIEIALSLPGRELRLRAWRVRVGRVDLYLLDSNLPDNRPEDRDVTSRLYGGDAEMRLQQEIVLGRGGVRLLREVGIQPSVWHINEGHAAFLTIERASYLMRREGLSRLEARELVRATTLFTTHTPVPAGHDRFGEDLMRRYFSDVAEGIGLSWERFMALGSAPEAGQSSEFNMTYLALSLASWTGGVSRLHGAVSRRLLSPFWPRLLEQEVPVSHVTNGVHLGSWLDPELAVALDLPPGHVRAEDLTARAAELGDGELWQVRCSARKRLVQLVRKRLEQSFLDRHDSPRLLARMQEGLVDDALYIGFARRFAPYKRAQLLFQDAERLRRLLGDPERPVRVIVAGKAHPADEAGKSILREVARHAREEQLCGRVFFVEDYDIELGRALTQGVDVWLNNPTRGLEASGTSGMKAGANGVLNLSIGDGWWLEGWDGTNGWQIGDERAYEDQVQQDELDSATLHRLLAEEVVPQFFERGPDGVPAAWVERMRRSLVTIPAFFNTDRMVSQYADQAYRTRSREGRRLAEGHYALARAQAAERERVRRGFREVRIVSAEIADVSRLRTGDEIDARVDVALGSLTPEDVSVELVLVREGAREDRLTPIELELESALEGVHRFRGSDRLDQTGSWSYGIRVRPRSALDPADSLVGVVVWA